MIDIARSSYRLRLAAAALAVLALPLAAQPARAQYGTFGTDQNSCDRSALGQILSTSKGNLVGSIGGAALGGLLGNQIGKGGGNTIATIVGVVGGALAGGYIGRSMDSTDQACVGQTLEHTPSNQTVAWRNPDNGSSYWVTPTGSYQQNGQPCRNYVTQAVVNGQTQRSDGTACRDQGGAWHPVNAPAQGGYAPQGAPQGGYAPPPQQPSYNGAISQDMVFKVQQRLRELGFYVRDNIDGRWGPRTAEALGNFQRANNLNPTGQLDQQTMAALGLGDQPQPQ